MMATVPRPFVTREVVGGGAGGDFEAVRRPIYRPYRRFYSLKSSHRCMERRQSSLSRKSMYDPLILVDTANVSAREGRIFAPQLDLLVLIVIECT